MSNKKGKLHAGYTEVMEQKGISVSVHHTAVAMDDPAGVRSLFYL